MKIYYPYRADDGKHKFYIITKTGRRVYFGAIGYDDYTTHKNPLRKANYIARHRTREDWTKSGVDTPGWWSFRYLWSYTSKAEAYAKIKQDLMKWGLI
jgi:hypothetical protein